MTDTLIAIIILVTIFIIILNFLSFLYFSNKLEKSNYMLKKYMKDKDNEVEIYKCLFSMNRRCDPTMKPDKIFKEIIVTYPPEDRCSYPEYRGKAYFEIRYLKNGEDCIGFGTYNPKVLSSYLSKHFINNYKAGSEDVEVHPINENITKGFEEFTKMMFKQGQAESEGKKWLMKNILRN